MGRGDSSDATREPCPDRILWDTGGAFSMGTVGSSILYACKGLYTGGKGRRIATGLELARMKAPVYGGSFAVWGGLYSIFDCTAVYLRQKEDPYNSIMSGAAAGAILAARQGPKAMIVSGAFGGVLLTMIEGAVFLMNKIQPNEVGMQGMPDLAPAPIEQQQQQAPQDTSSGGWGVGGLFGWGKKHQVVNGGGTEMLESFDTPSPPDQYKYEWN